MKRAAAFSVAALLFSAAVHGAPSVIRNVAIDRGSFNPSTSDNVTLSATFSRPGKASVVVLDRDGFITRHLTSAVNVNGTFSIAWNGRDDNGHVVPDEAYSFRIQWTDGRSSESYFPANEPQRPMLTIPPRYYDRRGGTLSYALPVACRVHAQAGTSPVTRKGKPSEGPVLKTIVNRAPRPAGAVAEHWNGFDESGAIYVPDLRDFIVAIAADPLPENSVIAFGHRGETFAEYALVRKGASEITRRASSHEHHQGLSVFDDLSPDMRLEVVNGRWNEAEKLWNVSGSTIRVRPVLAGFGADHFAHQPGYIYRFVNERQVGKVTAANGDVLEIPLSALADGVNRVTVNWVSGYGPVAANTIRFRREPIGGSK